mmetsp:Transcript_113252/g.283641  ORF Transcript_113252/g.283641 Transcript_113252/m.283641 type:complete len:214 (+) Transcript_113252:204-845(+)
MRHFNLSGSWFASSNDQSKCASATASSSSQYWSARYSCLSASWAVMRLFGSNLSILSSMSHCNSLASGKIAFHCLPGMEGNRVLMKVLAASLEGGMKFKSASAGVPKTSQIDRIWSKKSEPRNRGVRLISSPRMQPALHISTAAVYSIDVRTISGARYHLVPTYSVRRKSSSSCENPALPLASPKSHNLMSQFLLTRTFKGFKSRWTTLAECK